MIVLDAGVIIAFFNRDHVHHVSCARFIEANAAERFCASGVTLAETLVRAVEQDVAEELLEDYETLGIEPVDVPGGSAAALARVRAESGLRMPDAIVLFTAELTRAELATTDAAAARAAERRGITAHLLAA